MVNKPEDRKQEDQDIEDYLQGDSALTETYRSEEKIQPPAYIDKAILSAANEAVRSEQTSNIAYSPFARNWYVPASMVAVLVLCVGLVFTIYQNSGQTLLTAPKSEYDFNAQILPMEIESAESKVQQKPTSKTLLREKASEKDDVSLPETAPAMTDKIVSKKDASKQTMSDSPHIPERGDASGRLEAADVKKQKQLDASELNNKLGEMELKVIEQGASSDQESHYRQAIENLLKQNESPNKETLDDDKAIAGVISSEKSIDNEMMTPEHWLKKINNLWVSGDRQIAKENLTLFFETYPNYPVENAKAILDPQIDLIEYTSTPPR